MRKILIIALIFYFLALLQTSFLVHFDIFQIIPNLILILVIALNFFEDSKKNSGILGAVFGGFFWDVFSSSLFGFHILILVGLAIFIKMIFKRYVRIPIIKRS